MSSARGFVSIEVLSRRDALRRIALGVTAAGLAKSVAPADAAEVHEQVAEERTLKGEYRFKHFKQAEIRTLERLSELIVPADEGGPSGREGGAPEFIDLLAGENSELADIFSGGMLWLDSVSGRLHGKPFVEASEEQQTAILDGLVAAERDSDSGETRWQTREYRRFSVFGVRRPADMRQGLPFFQWARRLIVDAYYTSPAGIEDLGFLGNASHTEYKVPREAVDHAVSRSPFYEV